MVSENNGGNEADAPRRDMHVPRDPVNTSRSSSHLNPAGGMSQASHEHHSETRVLMNV